MQPIHIHQRPAHSRSLEITGAAKDTREPVEIFEHECQSRLALQVSLVAKDAREELEQTRDGRFERAEPLRSCRLGLFRRAGW